MEIAVRTRCDLGGLTNAYNAMDVELELPAQPILVTDRIPKLATELKVPEGVRRRALELAQVATDAGITVGCRPSGAAAGYLYPAAERCGLCLSQREIADVAGVSPTTLRSRWDDLLEM